MSIYMKNSTSVQPRTRQGSRALIWERLSLHHAQSSRPDWETRGSEHGSVAGIEVSTRSSYFQPKFAHKPPRAESAVQQSTIMDFVGADTVLTFPETAKPTFNVPKSWIRWSIRAVPPAVSVTEESQKNVVK